MNVKVLLGFLAAAFLGACAGPSATSREDSGTVLGAIGGGLIGNQFGKGGGRVAATIGGAVVGGLIGNQIGKDLDQEDRRRAEEAYLASLERGRDGERREWRNPNNGNYGYVTPRRVYMYESMTCREYEQTIYVRGRPETLVGRACRQPDGSWRQV